jgi:hypothetical protein
MKPKEPPHLMIILPRKQENKVFQNLNLSKKYICENIFAKFMQSDSTHMLAWWSKQHCFMILLEIL